MQQISADELLELVQAIRSRLPAEDQRTLTQRELDVKLQAIGIAVRKRQLKEDVA